MVPPVYVLDESISWSDYGVVGVSVTHLIYFGPIGVPCGDVHFVRVRQFTRARVATAAILPPHNGSFAAVFMYFW